MIKYLGSKRALLPWIVDSIQSAAPTGTAVDLFSGTARVGHALKRAGYRVHANDATAYAATLARCYVQADAALAARATRLIDEARALPPRPGYFTRTFCEQSRFFQPHNGARIDAIRAWIAEQACDAELEAVLLVSLMEAADRVDSTTGVQMAYLKEWAPRSFRELDLRLPELLPRPAAGRCTAHRMDALEAARTLRGDVAYLDPPYNQHKYLGNYHVWETLVRWDAPEHYGVACKRVDTRAQRSPFNSRPRIAGALREVVDALDVGHLFVSFSDEGFLARDEIEEILSARGALTVHTRPHRRYVGARIGIHSPAGEKVGTVSHVENSEFLFHVRARG